MQSRVALQRRPLGWKPNEPTTRVETSRFCPVAARGVEPGTVGYEPLLNRHESRRATNNRS
jgi:hypothetical protein